MLNDSTTQPAAQLRDEIDVAPPKRGSDFGLTFCLSSITHGTLTDLPLTLQWRYQGFKGITHVDPDLQHVGIRFRWEATLCTISVLTGPCRIKSLSQQSIRLSTTTVCQSTNCLSHDPSLPTIGRDTLAEWIAYFYARDLLLPELMQNEMHTTYGFHYVSVLAEPNCEDQMKLDEHLGIMWLSPPPPKHLQGVNAQVQEQRGWSILFRPRGFLSPLSVRLFKCSGAKFSVNRLCPLSYGVQRKSKQQQLAKTPHILLHGLKG